SPSEARGGDELICIPFFMSGRTGRQGAAWAFSWLTDEINRGKQRDPNDVDEVPVIRNDDGCSGLRRRELADLRAEQQEHECDEAADDVQAVETGGHVEHRAVHAAGDGRAVLHQGDVLVALA